MRNLIIVGLLLGGALYLGKKQKEEALFDDGLPGSPSFPEDIEENGPTPSDTPGHFEPGQISPGSLAPGQPINWG